MGRNIICALLLVSLSVSSAATSFAGDNLEDLRQVVRTPPAPDSAPTAPPPSPPPPEESSRRPYSGDELDWNDDLTLEDYCILGFGLVLGATSPFWAPPMLMDDDGEVCHFEDFPHAHRQGYLVPKWRDAGPDGEPIERNFWSTRTRVEYGTNFSEVDWLGANVMLENAARFGVDGEFRWLNEDRPLLPHDRLMLGDGNVIYRFAQCARAEVRTGLGFNYLIDSQDTNLGFNFTYAADWYPTRPVVVSGELDLGWLGHAAVTHVRVTTGVNLKHVETFFGYDSYHIGDFDLEGLVAGLRVWY